MTVIEVVAAFVAARPGGAAAVAETTAAEIELISVVEFESLESKLSEDNSLVENQIEDHRLGLE